MTFGILLHALAYAPLVSKMSGPPSPNQLIIVHPNDNLTAVFVHAAAGDTLLLSDGTYKLDAMFTIDKDITIAAQNSGRAVLDGQQKVRVLFITSGNVSVSGINITGGFAQNPFGAGVDGGGVFVEGGTVTFDNCNIYSNTADSGGGVLIGEGPVAFDNCNIYSNTARNSDGGGVVVGGGTVTFDNCNIYSNTARAGGGVLIQGDYQGGIIRGGGTVTFDNCNIHNNQASEERGGGLAVFGEVTLKSCQIYNNKAMGGGGVYVEGTATLSNCNVTNNTASSRPGGGILVDESAPPPTLDAKCVISHNIPDNCCGFWSSPACFGSLFKPVLRLKYSK